MKIALPRAHVTALALLLVAAAPTARAIPAPVQAALQVKAAWRVY